MFDDSVDGRDAVAAAGGGVDGDEPAARGRRPAGVGVQRRFDETRRQLHVVVGEGDALLRRPPLEGVAVAVAATGFQSNFPFVNFSFYKSIPDNPIC